MESQAFQTEYSILDQLRRQGALMLRDGDMEIVPGVKVWDAFGHTPGHQILTINRGGQSMIITGDAMHRPFQVADTGWSKYDGYGTAVEGSVGAGTKIRNMVLDMAERDNMVFAATHFFVPFGMIEKNSDGQG